MAIDAEFSLLLFLIIMPYMTVKPTKNDQNALRYKIF
jgi:hypothetical protein